MKKILILILLVFLNTYASADRLVKNGFLNNEMGYEMDQNINDPKNKMEAIRNYVHSIETEIAVLDMKEQMIHYMAKIVVLDAMSLAENITFASENEKDIISTNFNDPVNIISIFTN